MIKASGDSADTKRGDKVLTIIRHEAVDVQLTGSITLPYWFTRKDFLKWYKRYLYKKRYNAIIPKSLVKIYIDWENNIECSLTGKHPMILWSDKYVRFEKYLHGVERYRKNHPSRGYISKTAKQIIHHVLSKEHFDIECILIITPEKVHVRWGDHSDNVNFIWECNPKQYYLQNSMLRGYMRTYLNEFSAKTGLASTFNIRRNYYHDQPDTTTVCFLEFERV